MSEFQREIDARCKDCPTPVVMTKQALKEMVSGEVLHVVATDPASVQDINMLLDAISYQLLETNEANGEFHFYIKKS